MVKWDGEKLRQERKANNQSLGDLAHFLGVWPQTIIRWETGESEPRARFRKKLELAYPALLLPEAVKAGA
jgi:transcriptional regulator with XRE-family HTH domain